MDGADALSKVSGLPRPEVQAIFEKVKANHRLLDACAGPHDFSLVDPAAPPFKREYRCARCGGVVDHTRYAWYAKGLEHGRRQP